MSEEEQRLTTCHACKQQTPFGVCMHCKSWNDAAVLIPNLPLDPQLVRRTLARLDSRRGKGPPDERDDYIRAIEGTIKELKRRLEMAEVDLEVELRARADRHEKLAMPKEGTER